MNSRRASYATLLAALPIAAAIVVHAEAFGHGFIWDDPQVIEQVRQIKGLRDLVIPPDVVPKFYYRPLIFLTFVVDRFVGGEAPFWFHATVIGWHALATGLVFLLGCHLLGPTRKVEASVAALLFAVHPIHVESVAWIAGRSDVIATALVVAAVLVGARTTRAATAWAAGGFLFAGLLAKEVALAGLVLIPARDLFVERRLFWGRYLPLFAAALTYVALRRVGLGTVATGTPSELPTGQLLYSVFAAIGWYISMLAAPLNLNAYVPHVPAGPVYAVAGLVAVAAMVAVAVWALRNGNGAAGFLSLWLVVSLAPSLVVILRRSASAVLAERYLYLPSVAGVLLVGWLLAKLRPASRLGWRVALLAVLIAVVFGASLTVARTRIWANDLAFWSDIVAKTPEEPLPRRELGNSYLRRNRLTEAEQQFVASLAARDTLEGRVMAHNNLGNLYLRRGDLDVAQRAFESALRLHPHHYLYNGLARVAMKRAEVAQARGQQEEVVRQVLAARQLLEQALSLDPDDYKSHVLLGQVLFSLAQYEAAREHLQRALRIEPHGAVADVARRYLRQLPARPTAPSS